MFWMFKLTGIGFSVTTHLSTRTLVFSFLTKLCYIFCTVEYPGWKQHRYPKILRWQLYSAHDQNRVIENYSSSFSHIDNEVKFSDFNQVCRTIWKKYVKTNINIHTTQLPYGIGEKRIIKIYINYIRKLRKSTQDIRAAVIFRD